MLKSRIVLPIALWVAMLSGCSVFSPTATTQQVQADYVKACSAYSAAFSTALQLRVDGKLTRDEVVKITTVDNQIYPICTGPFPANPDVATQQITAAITTLVVLETAKGVK